MPARIRETRFEDYNKIAALQGRNSITARHGEDWIGLWVGNPAYTDYNDWPIGFVLENECGEIVGSIETVPFIYWLNGRKLRAAAIGGWVVDPGYRGFSMKLLDRASTHPPADFVVTTTASTNAEPVLKALGWSRAPRGTWNRSAFWVTGYRQFAKVALRASQVPFAGVLTYPVAVALFCCDQLRRAWSGIRTSAAMEIVVCSDFDHRFDEFWTELSRRRHGVLLAGRDRKTLAWHFRHHVSRQNGWILAANDRSGLVAYAIFDRRDNVSERLKRVRLIDFQALPGAEHTLASLLAWMLRECRQERFHVLENIGCWLDRSDLPNIRAPYHRNLKSWSFYYRARDRHIEDMLSDPTVWVPSLFDGDACL